MTLDESGAVAALEAGEVVAIPTDTVYGLAVHLGLPSASKRLFAVKGRPESVALPVLVADVSAARLLGVLDAGALALTDRYWPGALTVVVARQPAASALELGGDPATIGLRCPASLVALGLLERTGPLAVTSANRHGEPPCRSADDVLAVFGASARVIDGGECRGEPSTVVRLDLAGVRCLRAGAVSMSEIEKLLGRRSGKAPRDTSRER
ncbi:MAG: L-threonylcarbamoyladenylate synthase [Acidimicrobiales bacterium]